MRYLILAAGLLTLTFYGCGNQGGQSDKMAKRDSIARLQDSLQKGQKPEALKKDAQKLVRLMNAYVAQHPADTVNPEYLYSVANYHFNYLRNPKKAIDKLEQLRQEYPEHEKAPFALFTQGFMYQKLNQLDQARAKYESFLEKYPDHEMARDVKLSIKGLGLSNKEQLEQAEKIRERRANARQDSLSGKAQ